MKVLAHALLVCASPTLGAAQSTIFPLSVTGSCGGGGTRFVQRIEASRTSPYAASASFGSTDPADCDASTVYAHACFWRVASDARLSQLYDSGTGQGGVTHTPGGSGDSWTVRWPDAADRGVLDAQWTQSIDCRTADHALVTNTWVLKNTAANQRFIEFYAYVDVDLGDYRNNETSPVASNERQIISDDAASPTFCGTCIEFFGAAPSTWEIDFYPNTERKLTSSPFAALSDSGPPFGPDDYTGAYGWSRQLQPNESMTIVYTLGRNALYCATPGSASNYGAASNNLMGISTSDTPTPGAGLTIDLLGPPSTSAAVFVGVLPLNVQFPGCPVTVLVDPFASIGVGLDSNGMADFPLDGPCAPGFCGLSIYFQLWALDPTLTCLPVQHSDGLVLTYGHP